MIVSLTLLFWPNSRVSYSPSAQRLNQIALLGAVATPRPGCEEVGRG